MANEAQTMKQLIRVKLLESSDVTELVEGRIFGAHFQDPDAQTPTYPLVILDWIGAGRLQYSKAFQTLSMDIWCYDRVSAANALNIYGKVQDSLHQQRLSVDGIPQKGVIRESVRPVEGYNEKVRAYYARGEYLLIATAVPDS